MIPLLTELPRALPDLNVLPQFWLSTSAFRVPGECAGRTAGLANPQLKIYTGNSRISHHSLMPDVPLTPPKCLLSMPVLQEPSQLFRVVLKNRLDTKARQVVRGAGSRTWRLTNPDPILTSDLSLYPKPGGGREPWHKTQRYPPELGSGCPCALRLSPPPTVVPGVKNFVTSLVFFSYCRYRDLTTLPPAGRVNIV